MSNDDRVEDLFTAMSRTAAAAPRQHTAIVDGDYHLSYRKLLSAAAAFCDELSAAGVQTGDRVAVILGNHKEFLIAALGIWKRGAILAALNPQLREAELCKYLVNCGARSVATTWRNQSMLEAIRADGVPLEHAWLYRPDVDRWMYRGERKNDTSLAAWTGHCSAVTQYSTGSTGHPKRVTRTHQQLLGEARSVATRLEISAADRVLVAAPLFHSYGLIVSALATLIAGGTVYVLDTFLPGDAGRLVEQARITALPGVPFMFQLLAEHRAPLDLTSLRVVLSAGAPLPARIAQSFEDSYGRRIRRLYGSTETGAISISDHADSDEADTVGRAISGVTVDVIDDSHQNVSAGERGLIRVTSEFAATGYDCAIAPDSESYYLDRSFIPGDLGILSPSGKLTLAGRRRNFINVNGYKVDPAEVETTLLEMPEISEAAVLGIHDAHSGERIKAVLVMRGESSERSVRAHCVQRLAAFKCPQIIEFRPELPKNRLGKVLRTYLLDEPASPSSP